MLWRVFVTFKDVVESGTILLVKQSSFYFLDFDLSEKDLQLTSEQTNI